MNAELNAVFDEQGGAATSKQILEHLPRRTMQRLLRDGAIVRIWPAIYCLGEPTTGIRLRGLELHCGEPIVTCLGSAAAVFGFDTENTPDLHVLNPEGHLLRTGNGVVVHRREGAPLTTVGDRPITEPAWTAIEVARSLRRPRALATLDAALRTGTCTMNDLQLAARKQRRRRGIIVVRELIPLARAEAESPMESESRLRMIDGEIPMPVLQFEIIDRDGQLWRVDFAWPNHRVCAEYDGFTFHSTPEALAHDRQKREALAEMGWQVISIVADDVRRNPGPLLRRLRHHLGVSTIVRHAA